MNKNFTTKSLFGNEIIPYLDELAKLRIKVFYDYPYLYEGNVEYEKNYLKVYADSPRSVLVVAFDQDKMIGAASALPLQDEADYIQAPFLKHQIPLTDIYYFGESVLLKEYRGHGLGHAFFDGREAAAKKFGFKQAYFCGVKRADDHPLKPKDFKPLDEFWMKRGYQKLAHLQSQFSWPDRGEKEETSKTMIYWMKSL